jgi:hypothetical protein
VLDFVFKGIFPLNNDFIIGDFREGFILKDFGWLIYLPKICRVTR